MKKGECFIKIQWTIIAGLIFTVIVALFSYLNIVEVPVNYYFGEANWPLIVVILGSTLIGFLISACFSAIRMFALKHKVSLLQKDLYEKERKLAAKNSDYISLKLQMKGLTKKDEI